MCQAAGGTVGAREVEVPDTERRGSDDSPSHHHPLVDDTARRIPAGVPAVSRLDVAAVVEVDAYGAVGNRRDGASDHFRDFRFR